MLKKGRQEYKWYDKKTIFFFTVVSIGVVFKKVTLEKNFS
jgi:hypothetical protein